MSAGSEWRQEAPKENDEPALPQAPVSAIWSLADRDDSALSHGPVTNVDVPSQAAPDATHDGTVDALLSAIQGTDVARRLAGVAGADRRQPEPPAFAVWANTPAASRPQPAPPVRRISAAASPASTRLVQAPQHAASTRLMPVKAPPPQGHAAGAPPQTAEPLPIPSVEAPPPHASAVVHEPPHVSPVVRQLRPPAAGRTLFIQTPPSASPASLMPPATAPSRRPAPLAPPRPRPPLTAAAAPQNASRQQRPAVIEPAPAVTVPLTSASATGAASISPDGAGASLEINFPPAKATLTLSPVGHTGVQLATRLKNWIETYVPRILEGMRRTGTLLSLRLKSWAESKAAPSLERTSRLAMQGAISLRHRAGREAARALQGIGRAPRKLAFSLQHRIRTEAAPARQRMSRAGTQLSSSLKPSAETEPAQAAQSMARAKPQVSTRLKARFGPRRNPRLVQPPVVAYCWTADTPHALNIADISTGGIHLLTEVRWPLGATVPITLQRTDRPKEALESWIVTDFMILRWCEDGLAGTLIPPTPYSIASGAVNCADQKTLKRFVKQLAVPGRR